MTGELVGDSDARHANAERAFNTAPHRSHSVRFGAVRCRRITRSCPDQAHQSAFSQPLRCTRSPIRPVYGQERPFANKVLVPWRSRVRFAQPPNHRLNDQSCCSHFDLKFLNLPTVDQLNLKRSSERSDNRLACKNSDPFVCLDSWVIPSNAYQVILIG